MSTAGRKLLSSLVYSGDKDAFGTMGLTSDFFKDSEKVLFEFLHGHLMKFGKLPDLSTISEYVGDALTDAPEPPKFYLEQVEKRYLQSNIKMLLIEVQDLLKEENPDKAFEILMNGTSKLHIARRRCSLIDFRDIQDLVYSEYMLAKSGGDKSGMMFGWPTLDEMSGGLKPGDFAAFVGRPASGKTFMGLYTALNAWQGDRVPLFVSMEMNYTLIGQRLAAMTSKKNLTQLMKGIMTTKAFKAMMDILATLKTKPLPLWIVDGNLMATVDDLLLNCQQLKPSCLWVDGAYLLGHSNPKVSRFERITDNAEALKKRVANDLGIPVVASYQFGRSGPQKKPKAPVGKKTLEDIYGTDAIGQLASIVVGLDDDETIETEKQRTASILKGRGGETGSFKINWDFLGMDFSEVIEEKPEELQFVG